LLRSPRALPLEGEVGGGEAIFSEKAPPFEGGRRGLPARGVALAPRLTCSRVNDKLAPRACTRAHNAMKRFLYASSAALLFFSAPFLALAADFSISPSSGSSGIYTLGVTSGTAEFYTPFTDDPALQAALSCTPSGGYCRITVGASISATTGGSIFGGIGSCTSGSCSINSPTWWTNNSLTFPTSGTIEWVESTSNCSTVSCGTKITSMLYTISSGGGGGGGGSSGGFSFMSASSSNAAAAVMGTDIGKSTDSLFSIIMAAIAISLAFYVIWEVIVLVRQE